MAMGRLLACLLLFLAACRIGPVLAAPVADLGAPVAPGSPRTFAQLAGAVFPGLARDPETGEFATTAEKVLRQPGTRERVTLPAGARLGPVEAFRVRGDGRTCLVTLWTVAAETGFPGDTATVLAVFPEGAGDPTDVASVQTDVFCDTGTAGLLAIGPDDAFVIRNHHSNSNQSYLETGLFHIVDGRLRRIASVFTLDVRADCGHTFFETLAWGVARREGGAYPDITATVTLSPRTDCPGGRPAVRARVFRETYRFDPAGRRYLPTGKGFGGLDAFNEKNL
jgi:hypothetical protein